MSDLLWRRLKPHLSGKVSDARATAKDNRLSGSGLVAGARQLAMARSVTWLWAWGQPGLVVSTVGQVHWLESVFKSMSEDTDLEYALIDSTIF